MEIRVLKYFLAVAHEENISRAAEVLHLSQPTLSRQMTQLEEELGEVLFIRGKRISLTEAGLMLRSRAQEIVSLSDKLEQDFAARREVCGLISVGSGGLNASRPLAELMAGFRKLYPKVSYHMYANSAEYVREQLEQGVLDFGLLMEPVDITKFDYIRMKEKEKWGLLLRSAHPLAKKDFITKEDLVRETLIVPGRETLKGELKLWLGGSWDELDIMATHNMINNSAFLVENGAACALTIEGAVNLFGSGRMVFKPLYPELSMTSVFAWKKFHPLSAAAATFLSYFKTMQNMNN